MWRTDLYTSFIFIFLQFSFCAFVRVSYLLCRDLLYKRGCHGVIIYSWPMFRQARLYRGLKRCQLKLYVYDAAKHLESSVRPDVIRDATSQRSTEIIVINHFFASVSVAYTFHARRSVWVFCLRLSSHKEINEIASQITDTCTFLLFIAGDFVWIYSAPEYLRRSNLSSICWNSTINF